MWHTTSPRNNQSIIASTRHNNNEYLVLLDVLLLRDMDIFFATEEAHAVMLAHAADRGGRAALKVTPTSVNLESLSGGRRPPGSSGKSRLEASAQFGAKKISISLSTA
jgi:hypothetical protein